MPRSKFGMKRKKYDPNDVVHAANLLLKQGWSVRQAALELKISKSTLARHVAKHKSSEEDDFSYKWHNDIHRVFSDEEEELLKNPTET